MGENTRSQWEGEKALLWLLCILENINYKSCFRVDQELAQYTAQCLLTAWSPFLPLPGLDTRLICGITPEEAGISDPVHTMQTWGLRGKSHVPPCSISSISFISGQARAEGKGEKWRMVHNFRTKPPTNGKVLPWEVRSENEASGPWKKKSADVHHGDCVYDV